MFHLAVLPFRLPVAALGALLVFAAPGRAAEPLVDGGWLAAHRADPGVVVLDVRPAADFAAAHIPDALAADFAAAGWRVALPDGATGALPPIERIGAAIAALGIGDDARVVIVADSFPAAARVYWTFRVLGHAGVSVLDGGFPAWPGAVARGPAEPRPAVRFVPHYDASLRAELGEVAAAAGTGVMVLVDARPPAQWSAGHLPGAVEVDERGIVSVDGHLKSPAALAALFAPVGGRPAIAYCTSGFLGAADWFVLSEILHHRGAKLYDGSMSEWTADASRPVVR